MIHFYRLVCILVVFLLPAGLSAPVFAMDTKQKKEFDRILTMPLAELTKYASNALQKEYPGEKWEAYRFPDYVFTNESVEMGYKIAVKKPELLSKIHCYCACYSAGHKNLLDCFLKGGKQGEYDNHASFCLTCYTQAILAFLWSNLDATDREIIEGMKIKFTSVEESKDK